MRVRQNWVGSPPAKGRDIVPRELLEMLMALALLAAAVVFAFTVVPGQPYLMLASAPWVGVATYLIGLGHARRSRVQ